ncbi:hypothetical protein [Hymenobacter chitinivorans]|uniref:Lipoprotein n=1 Tax=Hymenobacter chitinivorans DSM 11115 TaxID=1121954 RepID=A0A2M9BS04_9BACT|nr:hypothetical protein [Hymenobacter chitinivorans]PJJ60740.1 hypothetical protein CLV45_2171 [Hymenobacter chitinivorans DSM 11115]
MKNRFIQLATAGLLALGVTSCAEKQSSVADLTVAGASNATEKAGEIISVAQAVEWTHRFQKENSQKTWAVLFENKIYKQLLAQKGCQGLRIYNAINADDKNAFVLVGVDEAGDMTANGEVADIGTPSPPGPYASPLISGPAEHLEPFPESAGSIIPLDLAAKMTHRYQQTYPNGQWAGYYSAYVYNNLMEQPGCLGIRLYNGIKEDKSECYVLVGVNEKGNDMTDGLIYDLSAPCPPTCRVESPLMQ